jgi:hypothetical protein
MFLGAQEVLDDPVLLVVPVVRVGLLVLVVLLASVLASFWELTS